jgi:hypothetical protein
VTAPATKDRGELAKTLELALKAKLKREQLGIPFPELDFYLVQVVTKPTEMEALTAFEAIQKSHPSLLDIYSPYVLKADLGAKGISYRLRIGPIDTAASASNLCGQLKSQGVPDCSVVRFTQSPDDTLSTSLDR